MRVGGLHNLELLLRVPVVTYIEGSAKVTGIQERIFRRARKGAYGCQASSHRCRRGQPARRAWWRAFACGYIPDCVCFLGFDPWMVGVGLADSCSCAPIIRRFEKPAAPMVEGVQRSTPKKEKASGPDPLISPIEIQVCEIRPGDRDFSPLRPQSLVYNLNNHCRSNSPG